MDLVRTFYLDPVSREILSGWDNRYSSEHVEVLHVWNDPVNQRWPAKLTAPTTRIGDDVVINTDVLLAYPSPLPPSEFPASSGDATYRAMELFQFFARAADLDDPAVGNVPCTLYAYAPEKWSAPNETSWTSFKRHAIHRSDDGGPRSDT
ncbi:DUF1838 family protein [Nonomuraea sediminis]|uniref:DUF1838 family protein n=1 Tax=Nonomuraea sediminis TaxID=2835864 RepID=UPI001BDC5E72|nr:DUF1838 family protein [Nonomuraea sediminis]